MIKTTQEIFNEEWFSPDKEIKWIKVEDIIKRLESFELPAGKQIDDLIEELKIGLNDHKEE